MGRNASYLQVESRLKEYREEESYCEEHQNDIDVAIVELESLLKEFKQYNITPTGEL